MTGNVKKSIDARRDAFAASFVIDAAMQKKIDTLFADIEKMGAKCKDVTEFESKFQSSPLNQKYLDLFTEIATNSQPKAAAPKVSKAEIGKAIAGDAVTSVAEDAVDKAIGAAMPTRASVHQKISDEVRGVPVIGDAIDVGQKASYAAHLGKLFGKRKKKNDE